MEELVKRGGDVLVEPVELGKTLLLQFVVGGKGPEESSGERGVDSFKEFEKNQADAIAIGQKSVSARVRNLFDQPFGPKLGQVVAESGEAKPVAEDDPASSQEYACHWAAGWAE